jgi:uncharacterized protein
MRRDAMPDQDAQRRNADRVVDTLLDSLRRHDMRVFADQWAVDGVMEFPFAPPGYPRLLGRDAVWDYVKDYTDNIRLDVITEDKRHHTLDPETVILEFSVDGVALRTGSPYRMRYVSVISVGDSGIRLYRDYWNPLAVKTSLGEEVLASGLGGTSDE